jgi:hypothetical protein
VNASEMLLLPLTRSLSLAHSQLLKNAAWGLWFRVITGSGLSMVDLATDINVIRLYFAEAGQEGYGWMMLGMVLASMGLQLGVVLLQNRKLRWGTLLREVLLVVSGLKPGERERIRVWDGEGAQLTLFALISFVTAGVDAMRVVSNAKMDEHHMIDAKTELVATKMCEMFCESIPGERLAAGSAFASCNCRAPHPCLLQAAFCRSPR